MASYMAMTGVSTTVPTTAAPTAVATVNGIKTVLQVLAGSVNPLNVWKWGVNFDGSGTTPIKCELVHTTTVAATVTTGTAINAGPFESAITSNVTASTSGTGFNATAEGTVVAPLRYADIQQVLPGNYFQNEWSLGREFYLPPSGILRVRITDTAVHNCYAYICWDE